MAEHDLVVRGGFVVDGSGAPGREADIAIKHGKIAEIGPLTIHDQTQPEQVAERIATAEIAIANSATPNTKNASTIYS